MWKTILKKVMFWSEFVPEEDVEQYCSKVSHASQYFSNLGIEYFVNFKYKQQNEVICG